MIRVPALPIRWPRALARKQNLTSPVVVARAETELERLRAATRAERRKEDIMASAALDGRLFF
jgi:hypothetical protein